MNPCQEHQKRRSERQRGYQGHNQAEPTLGPVLENSLNFVVPISNRPMMIVPAPSPRPERARERHSHRSGRVIRVQVLSVPPRQEQAEIGSRSEQDRDKKELHERRKLPAREHHPGQ